MSNQNKDTEALKVAKTTLLQISGYFPDPKAVSEMMAVSGKFKREVEALLVSISKKAKETLAEIEYLDKSEG